jgi:uncharacterized RDD family membrane protein YckC
VASSEPADDAVPPYARFGARALAALLDALLAIGAIVPALLVVLLGPTHDVACTADGVATTCTQPTPVTFSVAAALLGIGLVGYTIWWARLAGRAQSVGQRAAGVRIADIDTGAPIGTVRALGRQFAKLLSTIPLGLGFWWMLGDDRRQTWHDTLAETVVVRTGQPEPGAA